MDGACTPITDHEFGGLMAPFSLGAPFAVAVSGGVDSLALTLLAHRYALRHGIMMTALTVDHQLRVDSTVEANAVHALLVEQGINHTILTWQHDGMPTTKIQEEARYHRYRLLWDWCQTNNVQTLLTAHHQGDLIETFFMRLAHRSGLKGLSSIRGQTQTPRGLLIRPLLSITKTRLIETMKSFGIAWHEDPSNENCKFERIRLRHALTQLEATGVLTADAVAASIQKLQVIDDFLDESVTAFFNVHSFSLFPLIAFQAQHLVLRRRILVRLLKEFSPKSYGAPDDLIDRVAAHMMQPTFKGATLGGLYLKRSMGGMVCVQKENRI